MREHSPALLMTHCAGAPYEPQAPCGLWLEHLWRVFGERQELVDFFQVLCGYAATGLTIEQKLAILYGTGCNGKSVTVGTLSAALGTYAAPAAFTTFTVRRNEGPRDDLARLYGKRLVTASEAQAGARLDESMIKEATGGEEIVCRRLYQESFSYAPQFQILLSTNHKPRIHGGDHAIWRRVWLLPFDVTIPDDEKDERIADKLRAELPGVLAWVVRGALRWGNEGLQAPADVLAATKAYRDEEDVFADFLEACCVIEENLSSTVGALHKAHTKWAEDTGEKAVSARAFKAMLTERGFQNLGHEPGTRRALVGGLSLSATFEGWGA
jgi:putative DNA primase/helicase